MCALIGVEAGGRGTALGEHAARFQKIGGGVPGVLQGTYRYVLQDDAGQVATTHSVSAGLDYASVGPEHAMLHDSGRATYTSATDAEALDAVTCAGADRGNHSGARESAHAVAEAIKLAPKMGKDKILMVNVSGRGDKDMGIHDARDESETGQRRRVEARWPIAFHREAGARHLLHRGRSGSCDDAGDGALRPSTTARM